MYMLTHYTIFLDKDDIINTSYINDRKLKIISTNIRILNKARNYICAIKLTCKQLTLYDLKNEIRDIYNIFN